MTTIFPRQILPKRYCQIMENNKTINLKKTCHSLCISKIPSIPNKNENTIHNLFKLRLKTLVVELSSTISTVISLVYSYLTNLFHFQPFNCVWLLTTSYVLCSITLTNNSIRKYKPVSNNFIHKDPRKEDLFKI
jgi:hypothetical protein